MTLHPSIKILVLLFSLGLASLMTWQLKKNLQNPTPEPAPKVDKTNEEQPDPSEEKENENQAYAIPIGPKSVGGSLDIGGNIFPVTPVTPENITENDKKENKQNQGNQPNEQPLLPSSKYIAVPLFQKKEKEKE